MTAYAVKTTIDAPCELVFDKATDFENCADFITGITRTEMLTPGPVAVGTRFRETRLMYNREGTEEMEVIQLDRPSSYTLGCESHGCRYQSTFSCAPDGETTVVEMTFEAIPLNTLARLTALAMRPMIKSVMRVCQQDLEDIKAAAESACLGGHT